MRSDSNLASIYSKEENDWIEQKMEVNTHLPTLANYWIGLKYDGDFSHIESILIDQGVLLLSGPQICLWSFNVILFNMKLFVCNSFDFETSAFTGS